MIKTSTYARWDQQLTNSRWRYKNNKRTCPSKFAGENLFFVFVCFFSTHHSWCWSFSKDETKDTATDGSFNKDRGKESSRKEKKLKGLVVVFGAGWYLAGPSLWNWLSVPQWLGPCPSRLIYTQLFLFPVGLFARLLATAACFPKVLLPVLFVSWQAECNCLIVFIT